MFKSIASSCPYICSFGSILGGTCCSLLTFLFFAGRVPNFTSNSVHSPHGTLCCQRAMLMFSLFPSKTDWHQSRITHTHTHTLYHTINRNNRKNWWRAKNKPENFKLFNEKMTNCYAFIRYIFRSSKPSTKATGL